MRLLFLTALFIIASSLSLFAQQDTTKPAEATKPLFNGNSNIRLKDTTAKVIVDTSELSKKPKHDPHKATLRSAIIPGWGQAYNREYWKIPIVYGALAIPASTYVYNAKYYKKFKVAYEAAYEYYTNGSDSLLGQIDSKLKYSTGTPWNLSTYQSYRNSFKRDKDYSLLWFLILWGVNVVDATVFAHLKDFDVSDNLGMEINPTYIPSTKSGGLSLVVSFKNPVHKPLPSF